MLPSSKRHFSRQFPCFIRHTFRRGWRIFRHPDPPGKCFGTFSLWRGSISCGPTAHPMPAQAIGLEPSKPRSAGKPSPLGWAGMMPGRWPFRSAKPFSGHPTLHQGFQATGSGCLILRQSVQEASRSESSSKTVKLLPVPRSPSPSCGPLPAISQSLAPVLPAARRRSGR
jgi:hypothetical protein